MREEETALVDLLSISAHVLLYLFLEPVEPLIIVVVHTTTVGLAFYLGSHVLFATVEYLY